MSSLSLAQQYAGMFVNISTGNVGIGTLAASNITISGTSVGIGGGGAGILANVGWTPTTNPYPTLTLPAGGVFAASRSNGQHLWIGNEVSYTFNVAGTVTAAPTNTAQDFKISVPYPVAVAASYPADTIVGDLWLSVIYAGNSNLFKAYARTISSDANSLVIRAITGSTDESLGTILANSVINIQGTATYATTTINQNTGGVLAAGLQTVWIPSTAVNWSATPTPPTFTLPAGAAMTYSRSNARYMYLGTDITYNVNVGGTVTSAPTSATSDYKLSLPAPISVASYSNDTVIGDMWLSVINGNNSNTFKAYARTTATDSNAAVIRLLTGSTDEAMGAIAANSVFTLQGTMEYTTTLANSNIGVPTSYVAADFKQDVYGNVNLNGGSNAPRARFDIVQNSNIPALIVDQYGTGDIVQVLDAGVSKVVVNSDGNVGIGITTPPTKLNIVGGSAWFQHNTGGTFPNYGNTVGSGGCVIAWNGLGGGGNGDTDFISFPGLGSGGFSFYGAANTGVVNNSPWVVIRGDGKVGIGTIIPLQSLHASSYIQTGIGGNTPSGGGSQGAIRITPANNSAWYDIYNYNGTLTVQGVGQATYLAYNGGGNWAYSSDARLKKDIIQLNTSNALDNITKLNPVEFLWNHEDSSSNSKHFGFIAQEVSNIIPNVISKRMGDSNVPDGISLSIYYNDIIALLVASIKEQQKEIINLINEVANLKQQF